MRRLLVLALVVLAAGCGAGPDDLFVIGGRTVSTAGAGLDGVPLQVFRLGDGPAAKLLHEQVSADGGLFSFDLVRVEVEPLSGRAEAWHTKLLASFPATGTKAWAELPSLPNQLLLPDFNDWEPGFALGAGGEVSFAPVTREQGEKCIGDLPDRETLIHGAVVSSDAGVYWEQTDHTMHFELADGGDGSHVLQAYDPVPLVIPPEALEDAELDVTMGARRIGCVEVSGGGPGTAEPYEVTTHWTQPQTVHVRGTVTPVSRGASCIDLGFQPCPLTDGDPARTVLRSPTNNFSLTLTRSVTVRTLVLRNALVIADGRPVTEISVRARDATTDTSVTFFLPPDPAPLEELQLLDEGVPAQFYWRYIVLPQPLTGRQFDIELNRTFLQLGEISLFAP